MRFNTYDGVARGTELEVFLMRRFIPNFVLPLPTEQVQLERAAAASGGRFPGALGGFHEVEARRPSRVIQPFDAEVYRIVAYPFILCHGPCAVDDGTLLFEVGVFRTEAIALAVELVLAVMIRTAGVADGDTVDDDARRLRWWV